MSWFVVYFNLQAPVELTSCPQLHKVQDLSVVFKLCYHQPLQDVAAMRYNVTAACGATGNNECNIVFQLWRPTEPSVFTLINSTMDSYNPASGSITVQVSLTFPLDINFTAGDMVGFSHISGRRPLEVHIASASSHSYLQWSSVSTVRSMLTTEDATTVTSQLPILNVEGNYMHVMPTLHII